MNSQNFRQRAVTALKKIAVPLAIIIAIFGAYVLYAEIREWRRDNAEAAENEKTSQSDRKADADAERAMSHLKVIEGSVEVTKGLVEAVGVLTGEVKNLAEQDRVISLRVEGLKNNYEKTRNQSRSAGGTKPNLALSDRKQLVFAADAELYDK